MKDSLIAFKDQLLQNNNAFLKNLTEATWQETHKPGASNEITIDELGIFFNKCISALEGINAVGGEEAREEFKRALSTSLIFSALQQNSGLIEAIKKRREIQEFRITTSGAVSPEMLNANDQNKNLDLMYKNCLLILSPEQYFIEQASFWKETAAADINRMKLWLASPQAVVERLLPLKTIFLGHPTKEVSFAEYLAYYDPNALTDILEKEEYNRYLTPEIKAKADIDSALGLVWEQAIKNNWEEKWLTSLKAFGVPNAQHQANLLRELFVQAAKGDLDIGSLDVLLTKFVKNGGKLNQVITVKEGDKTASLNILQFALHLTIVHDLEIIAPGSFAMQYPNRWQALEKLIEVLKKQNLLKELTAALNSADFQEFIKTDVLSALLRRHQTSIALDLANAGLTAKLPPVEKNGHPLLLLAHEIALFSKLHKHGQTAQALQEQMKPLQTMWDHLLSIIEYIDAKTVAEVIDAFKWHQDQLRYHVEFATPFIHSLLEKEHARVIQELNNPDKNQASITSCFSVSIRSLHNITIFSEISDIAEKVPLYGIIMKWLESKKESAPLAYVFYKARISEALNTKHPTHNKTIAHKLLEQKKKFDLSPFNDLIFYPSDSNMRKTFGIITGVGVLTIGLGITATLVGDINAALGSGVALSDALLLSGTAITLIGVIGLLEDMSQGNIKDKAIKSTAAIMAGPLIIGMSVYAPMLVAGQMNMIVGMEVTLPIGMIAGALAGLYFSLQYRRHDRDHLLPMAIVISLGAGAGGLISNALPQTSTIIASTPIANTTIVLSASLVTALVSLTAALANTSSYSNAT